MKKYLLFCVQAALWTFIGWELSDGLRSTRLAAEGSSYAQLAAEIQAALSSKYNETGTYYVSLPELPKGELSYADGGTPEMLNDFFYQIGPDKKSYLFCVYYFNSLQVYSGVRGKDSDLSLPRDNKKGKKAENISVLPLIKTWNAFAQSSDDSDRNSKITQERDGKFEEMEEKDIAKRLVLKDPHNLDQRDQCVAEWYLAEEQKVDTLRTLTGHKFGAVRVSRSPVEITEEQLAFWKDFMATSARLEKQNSQPGSAGSAKGAGANHE